VQENDNIHTTRCSNIITTVTEIMAFCHARPKVLQHYYVYAKADDDHNQDNPDFNILLLGALAVAADLSEACCLAVARPKLSGCSSPSTVLSQVCLGLPVLHR